MAADALRAYLRELRTIRHLSQKELAQAMGIALRTLITWELGDTEDIKSTALARAIHTLDGSMQDVYSLLLSDTVTPDDARRLAQRRLLSPPDIPLTLQPVGPTSIVVFTAYTKRLEADLQQVVLPFPIRAGERMYEGVRSETRGSTPTVLVNGQSFREVYRTAHGHDTGDLEWGYAGRGPQQLATALLTYECDLPDTWPLLSKPLPLAPDDALLLRSVRALQQYAALFVTTFPRDAQDIQWTLESRQFMLWVKLVIATVHATPDADPLAPFP